MTIFVNFRKIQRTNLKIGSKVSSKTFLKLKLGPKVPFEIKKTNCLIVI
jgi:hypothetical protein